MEIGVVDHVAEPGESALDRAYALAREMRECGESLSDRDSPSVYPDVDVGALPIKQQPRLRSRLRKRLS